MAEGAPPKIVVLAEHETNEELSEDEQFFIAYLRSLGADLTNGTAGGDGATGREVSTKTREAISKANKTWQTPEAKARIAQSLREYYARPENAGKQRARALQKTTEAASAAQKRRYADPAERVKASVLAKQRFADPAARQAMSDQRKGKPQPHKCKPVVDQFGNVYLSVKAAAYTLGMRPSAISDVLRGVRSDTRGYKFMYYTPLSIGA